MILAGLAITQISEEFEDLAEVADLVGLAGFYLERHGDGERLGLHRCRPSACCGKVSGIWLVSWK